VPRSATVTSVRSWSRLSSRIRNPEHGFQKSQLFRWQCRRQHACMNTNTHALARPRPLAMPLAAHMAEWLAHLGASMAQCLRAAGSGAGELRAMDDRGLQDLGIGRSEIGHVLDNGRVR
jgi:hypothetical protein